MKLATRIFRKDRGTASDEYYVTSPFGWRKDPISGKYKGHNGCDYGTHGKKWAQYCLEDGTVENVYKDNYGAICVRIAYPRLGYRCTHGHLDKASVSKGQRVNKDTILGYTGSTGYSTGVHLHLGVQRIGESMWIDPECLDYQEKPIPPKPTPTGYPFNATIKKGVPLYDVSGNKYKNGTSQERAVIVEGESNGRYKIYGKTFRPNIVYCDMDAIKKAPSKQFPFQGIIKKGSNLYTKQGVRYQNGTKANRQVTVQGEYNGRYEIYGKTFNPHIVYCDKSSIK